MSGFRQALLLLLLLPSLALAEAYVAVVQGLAGEPFYQRQFDEQNASLVRASKTLGDNTTLILSGKNATKSALQDWFKEIAVKVTNNDTLLVYLVGHGSYDQRNYKFNLPGPDLTDQDLLELIDSSNAGTKFLLSGSSSSGALLEHFKDKNIILATATKNGREKNATRFGRFFSIALETEAADLDKNKAISITEAFTWADRATADFYESEGLLATEHANLIGENADRVILNRWQQRPAAATNPALANLYQQRDDIDREIERLRLRRIGMSDDDYLLAFQQLILGLGDIQDLIDLEMGDLE